MPIDHMPDDVFISVTEALALASEFVDSPTNQTLLVVTLDDEQSSAVIGGDTSPESLQKLRALLDALADRTVESPEVLHITA